MSKRLDNKTPGPKELLKKDTPVSAELRGEAMAYALQSGAFSIAANLFEPYINYRIQKHFAPRNILHPGQYGNYGQNLLGELAGDLTGVIGLISAEAIAPKQLHACTRTMRSWVDPLYTTVARWVLASEKNSPAYETNVREWADTHERNLVRSSIIMTANVAGNVAAQKWLIGNPSSTKLIFAGKLASSAVTTSLGLAMRLMFPDQTKNMDRWISKKIFMPLLTPDTGQELQR